MQVASILSDLTSLRVCDHSAALALVSVRVPAAESPNIAAKQAQSSSPPGEVYDTDMERALDLMELHHGVKMKHVRGEDQGLMQARRDVDVVLNELEKSSDEQKKGGP
ncbi:MAG: hypothetical protein Q9222_006523 [Ikaeria aurantiellina]